MKKTLFSIAFVALVSSILCACVTLPAAAAEARKAKKIGDRYYLSMNDAALLLGATKYWKAETRKAVLNVEGTQIRLTVLSPIVAVGEKTYVLPSPVLFSKGVLFIPVELFTETVPAAMGKKITWNQDTQYLSASREGTVPATVSVEVSDQVTYVTVESPERIEYSPVSVSKDGFTVLLEGASLLTKPVLQENPMVKGLSVGRVSGGAELRLALAPGVSGYSTERKANPPRIVLGFTSSEELLRSGEFLPFGTEAPRVASGRDYKVVVIDAGHGGADEGLRAGSSVEKQVNLELARAVKDALSAAGLSVVLTRNDDTQMSVDDRAVRANTVGGDIFVSIHCDGYPDSQAKGYSVEVLEPEGLAGHAGPRDSRSGDASGAASGNVDLVPWNEVARGHVEESASLARYISRGLGGVEGLRDAGFRRAPIVLFHGVDMPCVMVNCGFLTNPGDEALLRDAASQRRIAEAIARGIVEFVNASRR
jgi:N-acetylmuramoyl-L-alanine amidase